ncbi:hypothetical protein BCR34DRAFT_587239 [Clohesyomyces aquaticus]|uniref:Uncharacterized protein n=1 Tax=Clohesyomyces aquaticus TaxID=1231657 RepID=A0A1Y1ZQC5_9PLEO|nr:hypothetical protein BCR34DRAFT_587239 [Clohesyomyces aquaticus]
MPPFSLPWNLSIGPSFRSTTVSGSGSESKAHHRKKRRISVRAGDQKSAEQLLDEYEEFMIGGLSPIEADRGGDWGIVDLGRAKADVDRPDNVEALLGSKVDANGLATEDRSTRFLKIHMRRGERSKLSALMAVNRLLPGPKTSTKSDIPTSPPPIPHSGKQTGWNGPKYLPYRKKYLDRDRDLKPRFTSLQIHSWNDETREEIDHQPLGHGWRVDNCAEHGVDSSILSFGIVVEEERETLAILHRASHGYNPLLSATYSNSPDASIPFGIQSGHMPLLSEGEHEVDGESNATPNNDYQPMPSLRGGVGDNDDAVDQYGILISENDLDMAGVMSLVDEMYENENAEGDDGIVPFATRREGHPPSAIKELMEGVETPIYASSEDEYFPYEHEDRYMEDVIRYSVLSTIDEGDEYSDAGSSGSDFSDDVERRQYVTPVSSRRYSFFDEEELQGRDEPAPFVVWLLEEFFSSEIWQRKPNLGFSISIFPATVLCEIEGNVVFPTIFLREPEDDGILPRSIFNESEDLGNFPRIILEEPEDDVVFIEPNDVDPTLLYPGNPVSFVHYHSEGHHESIGNHSSAQIQTLLHTLESETADFLTEVSYHITDGSFQAYETMYQDAFWACGRLRDTGPQSNASQHPSDIVIA